MGIKDWFTTEKPYDLGGVREKVRVGTGIVFFKNILGFLIKLFVGIIGVVIICLLVLGVIVFTVRTFTTGTSDVFTTKIGVALSSFPAGQSIKNAFSKIFGGIWDPQEILEPKMKAKVDENTNKNLGVKFTKFTSEPGRFVEETDFRSYGWVEITPFSGWEEAVSSEKDAIKVEFNCKIDGEECGGSIEPQTFGPVSGPDTRSVTVSCECNSGEASRDVDGKIVSMKARYDFVTRGYMSVYVMGSKVLDNVRKIGGDVFEGIYDSKLDKKNGVVTSTYTNGPLKMAIGSYYTQPFTEGGPGGSGSYYIMKIELNRKMIGSQGLPYQMKGLKIFVPGFMEVDTKEGVFIDGGTEGEFNIYTLGSSYLKELNSPCEKMLLILDDLRNEDCRKLWEKGFIPVYADFRINDVESDSDLIQSYVIVEARYGYEESTYDDIIVMKKPEGKLGGEGD